MPATRSGKPLSAWGLLLRQARELHGITASELSAHLGVTKAYVGQGEFLTKYSKPLPKKYWPTLLKVLPSLTMERLERAAATDSGEISLPLENLNHDQQEVAVWFCAALPTLSKEEAFRIRFFLQERSRSRGMDNGSQA